MKSISRRQMLALTFVAMLSPFLRLIPRQVAAAAGRAAWLSPWTALPVLLALIAVLAALLKCAPGQGLARVSCRVLGNGPGKAAMVIWSLWLCLHSGFLLRSGADRFIGTIFPDSDPWIFVIVMALLALVAGLGEMKTLARAAEIFRPPLLIVLLLALAIAAGTVRPEFLFPVSPEEAARSVQGGVMVADTLCIVAVLAAFLAGYEEGDAPFFPSFARFTAWSCLLACAICVAVIGVCGATLTRQLTYPFFSVVRDLTVFQTVQRFEALVVGLWVLPDFVLVSMELHIAADQLMLAFEKTPREDTSVGGFEGAVKRRNKLVWLCVAVMTAAAVLIARDAGQLAVWAFTLVPAVNLSLCFGYPLLLFAVGKLRRKL